MFGSVFRDPKEGLFKPLPGFGLKDCDPLKGDQLRGMVNWGGKSDLSALKGKTIRLKLKLFRSSLYSLRFSPD